MRHLRGFSLLESLIGLSLFFFLLLGTLFILNSAKTHFLKLRNDYEQTEALHAASDKIGMDLELAGYGLSIPLGLGILSGIKTDEQGLHIFSRDQEYPLQDNLQSGQTKIGLQSISGIKAGRTLCIHNKETGELAAVASTGPQYIILEQPLENGYEALGSRLILIKKINLYLDDKADLLRRKVNSSSGQPLLEDTSLFQYTYNPNSHVLNIQIQVRAFKETNHVYTIRPKNLVLAEQR